MGSQLLTIIKLFKNTMKYKIMIGVYDCLVTLEYTVRHEIRCRILILLSGWNKVGSCIVLFSLMGVYSFGVWTSSYARGWNCYVGEVVSMSSSGIETCYGTIWWIYYISFVVSKHCSTYMEWRLYNLIQFNGLSSMVYT